MSYQYIRNNLNDFKICKSCYIINFKSNIKCIECKKQKFDTDILEVENAIDLEKEYYVNDEKEMDEESFENMTITV